jgi:hypothetical protein
MCYLLLPQVEEAVRARLSLEKEASLLLNFRQST